MAEPEDSELERLATRDVLGEIDEAESKRLREALGSDPKLREEHARMKEVFGALERSVTETGSEPGVPSGMLTALHDAREKAFEEMVARETAGPSLLSGGKALWLGLAAAAVLLIGIVALLGPGGGPGPVFAIHADALEAARSYHLELTKSPQLPPQHDRLVAHLEYLLHEERSAEAREILEALPEVALQLPDFRRLLREVNHE